MKQLAKFSLLLLMACKTHSVETVRFEHSLLNIEYPNNWVPLDEPDMILAISQYSSEEATNQRENASVIIVATDSIDFRSEGIMSFMEFVTSFKTRTLKIDNRHLEQDIKKLEVNGHQLLSVKYRVEGELRPLLQTQYFFSNLGKYVSIMGTHNYDNDGSEVTKIISTLVINN